MNESNPFESISDDWYFYSSMNKKARFISHILRGVTYFVTLEFESGANYDVQLKRDEVEKFLSKFTSIENEDEKTEDEIVNKSLKGDYTIAEEKRTKQNLKIMPVMENNKIEVKENNSGYINIPETIQPLPLQLYDAIALLKEKKIDVATAKEIANLSQVIINCAKVQIEYNKLAK